MTATLERPALAALLCSQHTHTVRCWWNPELAAWVCPPPGDGRT